MRPALAWTLYGLGHAWYVVFDRWSRIGMPWPIYRVYHGLMSARGRVQGSGRGPWISS